MRVSVSARKTSVVPDADDWLAAMSLVMTFFAKMRIIDREKEVPWHKLDVLLTDVTGGLSEPVWAGWSRSALR